VDRATAVVGDGRRWARRAAAGVVAAVLASSAVVAGGPSPAGAATEPDLGTPWTYPVAMGTGIPLDLAAAGTSIVAARYNGGVGRFDADGTTTTLSSTTELIPAIASDGAMVVWPTAAGGVSPKDALAAVPVAGGDQRNLVLGGGAGVIDVALAPGRAWFLDGEQDRVGTALLGPEGFGAPAWSAVTGEVASLAADPDGSAWVGTSDGHLLHVEPGEVPAAVATLTPGTSGFPIALGGDGDVYAATADGLARVTPAGVVTGAGGPSGIYQLSAGAGLVAYLAKEGATDPGYLRLDDGTHRILPRPRSSTGGGIIVSSDHLSVVVDGGGRLCASALAGTMCAATGPRWTPAVTTTITPVASSVDAPRFEVHITVATEPGSEPPSGPVTLTDTRAYYQGMGGVRSAWVVGRWTATLSDGEATITVPYLPPPRGYEGIPQPFQELQAAYLGDGTYATNTSRPGSGTAPALTADQVWLSDTFTYLLGRAIDGTAWTYWLDRLQGGSSRSSVATALVSSNEARRRLVIEDYRRVLGRTPTAATIDSRLAQLRAGRSITSIRTELAGGAEYWTKAGATHTKVIAALWRTYLGHGPDAAATARWLPRLQSGRYSRAQLAAALQDSGEGRRYQVAHHTARGSSIGDQAVRSFADALYRPRSEVATMVAITRSAAFER
jgi:hypothetical protein